MLWQDDNDILECLHTIEAEILKKIGWDNYNKRYMLGSAGQVLTNTKYITIIDLCHLNPSKIQIYAA